MAMAVSPTLSWSESPEDGGRQTGGVDFQDRQITFGIRSYDLGRITGAVGETDLNGKSPLDYMGIGNDITVLRENNAAAGRGAVGKPGGNAHYRGADAFHHIRDRGIAAAAGSLSGKRAAALCRGDAGRVRL